MARPLSPRRVEAPPRIVSFEPAGARRRIRDEVALSIDELEALRLADLEGLYHDDAARRMGVSRATFGRIVASARRTVARALVAGLALRVAGGIVAFAGERLFRCDACRRQWAEPSGRSQPRSCPACREVSPRRIDPARRRAASLGGPSGRTRRRRRL